MRTILILAGHGNSGVGHWQTEWATTRENCVRVAQNDWERPDCADWFERLEAAVAHYRQLGDVVVAAHSLGCLLTAYWAERTAHTIQGALLVAPPDPDSAAFPAHATRFSPNVTRPFAFPSIIVASTNDVYGSFDYATRCAHAWGSDMVCLGDAGHINADSGLGVWDAGWELLAGFE